jgi:hypothetical protein
MSRVKKRTFEREYVQIPNETAQAPQTKINKITNEKPIPLESSGLLLNLWSYNYDEFELHKTELYKRFAYNKETSVKRAWKFLMDAGYIIEFKYREGRSWEYVYYLNILPYTEEQKQIIWREAIEEYGEIRGLDFQESKTETSNGRPQTQEISNTLLKQDLIKEKQTKEKEQNLVNKELENLPEKNENKKEKKKDSDSSMQNISDYDGTEPYNTFLINITDQFYTKFALGRWNKNQWTNLVIRLTAEIQRNDTEIFNHTGYVYRCLENIAYKHDLKHGKVAPRQVDKDLPFYDWWLED